MAEATILQTIDGNEPGKAVFRLQVDNTNTFTVPGFKTVQAAIVTAHDSGWAATDSISVYTSTQSSLDGSSNILQFVTAGSTTDLVVTLVAYGRD